MPNRTIAHTLTFAAPSGKMFLYSDNKPVTDGPMLFCPDGNLFYGLDIEEFSGTSDDHRLRFASPDQEVEGWLNRVGDVIYCNGEQYTLPDDTVPSAGRQPVTLCQGQDGELFYVSTNLDDSTGDSIKLFIGDGGDTMCEVTYLDVWYDPSSVSAVYIKVKKGKDFFCPLDSNWRPPQWGSQLLIKLDPADYNIVETPDGEVSITNR